MVKGGGDMWGKEGLVRCIVIKGGVRCGVRRV